MAEPRAATSTGAWRAGRRGQALAELAAGLLATALVLSGLLAFGHCIAAALELRRGAREAAGSRALAMQGAGENYASVSRKTSVELPGGAAFRKGSATVKEEVHIPAARIADDPIILE